MMKSITFPLLIISSLASAARISLGYRGPSAYTPRVTSHAAVPTSSCGPGSSNSADPQTSLTLLSSLVAPNFAQNGLNASGSNAGKVASLTSTNNFINWCATVHLPITNGQQTRNGSCNPAPMGAIPAVTKMPSSKFVKPHNLAIIAPNTSIEIKLAVENFVPGSFVNPDTNYYAAPQQLDPTTGFIKGHVHVVVEALESLLQTTPLDPTKPAAFVAFNEQVGPDGHLSGKISSGLAEGVYRMSTIMASSNHQAPLLPIAVRGSSEDVIYLIVSAHNQSTNTTTKNSAELQSAIMSAILGSSGDQ